MIDQSRVYRARQVTALSSAALALVLMLAQPGLAAYPVGISRGFSLAGDRTRMRMDVTVLDTAPNSGLSINFELGGDEYNGFTVRFAQGEGSGRVGRYLWFQGGGGIADEYAVRFTDVSGPGCVRFSRDIDDAFRCQQEDYDWRVGRSYRVAVVRVENPDDGWPKWRVSVTDLETGIRTKVVSFRALSSGDAQLSEASNSAAVYSSLSDCRVVDRVAASVTKPVAAGSTVTWGLRKGSGGRCATLRALVDEGGTAKLVIRP